MTIGITINKSWNIYNFRKGIIQRLISDGHKVVAIAPHDEYSERIEAWGCVFEHLEISGTGSNPFKEIAQILGMRNLIKKHKIDVLLTYTIKCNVYGSLAARMCKIPVISNITGLGTAYLHTGLVSVIARTLYRIAFRISDFIFLQNPDDKNLFLEKVNLDESRIDLLPGSGINIHEFQPAPYHPGKPPVFLMISRLLIDKGVYEYFESASMIKSKYPEVRFRLIGGLDLGHRRTVEEIRLNEVTSRGIIEYQTHSDEIPEAIAGADAIVLPSYREGTPRTLLEGAALGRPLITTDVPGCREVVQDGENGYLCQKQDSGDLSRVIEQFILASDEKKIEMGEASRNIVVSKFDESIVIEKYLYHINRLAG